MEIGRKKSKLTKEDFKKAEELLGLDENLKPDPEQVGDKNDLKEFLGHLESKYEVIYFPYSDFKGPITQKDKKAIPERKAILPVKHSGKMYSILLKQLIKMASNRERPGLVKKAEEYYHHQIKQHEEKISGPNRNRHRKLASELGQIYLEIGHYKKFARTYIRFLRAYENAPQAHPGRDERLKSRYSTDFWAPLLESAESKLKEFSESDMKIFGDDPKMIQMFCRAIFYAQDLEPCLLIGETGTGKEIMAKIMHLFSPRCENNFVARNVAAYPDSLFESEIFGALKGSYTGGDFTRIGSLLMSCARVVNDDSFGYSVTDKGNITFQTLKGRPTKSLSKDELQELAGTAFLDEINSATPGSQAKLLRAIQEKEVQVLGDKAPRKFEAKIICAANNEGLTGKKKWAGRKDFFHRFSQIIELPTLREMEDSIPRIVQLELQNLPKKIGLKRKFTITDRAMKKIQRYHWPGNFRELSQVLYRSIMEADLMGRTNIRYEDIEPLAISTKEMSLMKRCFGDLTWDEIQVKYADYLLEKERGIRIKAGKAAGKNSKQIIITAEKKKAEMENKTT